MQSNAEKSWLSLHRRKSGGFQSDFLNTVVVKKTGSLYERYPVFYMRCYICQNTVDWNVFWRKGVDCKLSLNSYMRVEYSLDDKQQLFSKNLKSSCH